MIVKTFAWLQLSAGHRALLQRGSAAGPRSLSVATLHMGGGTIHVKPALYLVNTLLH
ncbi:MAG TPA: hypothetical protein VKA19_11190 [Alphaproteobacteria bacterium]|nr:hypothetical protein [Alphaproteobacteria bacterium]